MFSLILDTSSRVCILALCHDEEVLIAETLPHDNQLTKKLLPSIHAMLTSQRLIAKDLSYISIGVGPGSFTGTRVGVTIAKTLGFALQIPVLGFCSLVAFLPFESGRFLAVYHTPTGECFLLKGEKQEDKILFMDNGVQVSLDELSFHTENVDFIVAMPEAAPIKDRLKKRVLKAQPNLDCIASVCHQRFIHEDQDDLGVPELIYLRPPRAKDSSIS